MVDGLLFENQFGNDVWFFYCILQFLHHICTVKNNSVYGLVLEFGGS